MQFPVKPQAEHQPPHPALHAFQNPNQAQLRNQPELINVFNTELLNKLQALQPLGGGPQLQPLQPLGGGHSSSCPQLQPLQPLGGGPQLQPLGAAPTTTAASASRASLNTGSMQAVEMQALLCQHMDALELAVKLCRQYEQTLASFTTELPVPTTGAPLTQAKLSLQAGGSLEEQSGVESARGVDIEVAAEILSKEPTMDTRDAAEIKACLCRPFSTTSVFRCEDVNRHGSRELTESLFVASSALPETEVLPKQRSPTSVSEAESEVHADTHSHDLLEPLLQETETLPNQPFPRRKASIALQLEVKAARAHDHLTLSRVSETVRRVSLSIQEEESKFEQEALKIEGLAQRLRMNRGFNLICFAAILANGIWIGIDTDPAVALEAHMSLTPKIVDNAICGWYFIELLVWFVAFKDTFTALKSGWFVSHAMIVGLMVWGRWVQPLVHLPELISSRNVKYLSFVPVLRLGHIARVAHLFEHSPEIMLYATGVLRGIESVGPLLAFLGMNVYVFAIAFRWLLSDTFESFATVPQACHFLFLSAFGSVDKKFFETILEVGWLPWALFVAFTLVGNVTVAKMLTGVLLQVVNKLVQKEKEKSDTAVLEETMKELTLELDADGDGSVTKEEFEELMAHKDLVDCMVTHHVDVPAFTDFILSYFNADAEVFVEDIIRLLKQFCGFKPASVTDMMNMRKLISIETDALMKGQAKILEGLQETDALMKGQAKILAGLQHLSHRRSTSQETLGEI